jgi:signal transduction histidine kinase
MFTAMNRVRSRLVETAQQDLAAEPERCRRVLCAVNQVLDLELAIMLDTYREDHVARMRDQERLATIGQIAASIGHELRNPLGIVESSVFLIRQRLTRLGVTDEGLDRHAAKISTQVRQCANTVASLLDLARARPPARRRFALRPLIDHAIEVAVVAPEIVVEVEVPTGLEVFADHEQILQVIANLLENASQALGGSGHVWVRARSEGGGTVVEVRDDGPGVPAEIRERVFEALFTTKARGTGLGLALCRRVIDAHRGEIGLEPTEPGAAFRFWLPAPTDLPQ